MCETDEQAKLRIQGEIDKLLEAWSAMIKKQNQDDVTPEEYEHLEYEMQLLRSELVRQRNFLNDIGGFDNAMDDDEEEEDFEEDDFLELDSSWMNCPECGKEGTNSECGDKASACICTDSVINLACLSCFVEWTAEDIDAEDEFFSDLTGAFSYNPDDPFNDLYDDYLNNDEDDYYSLFDTVLDDGDDVHKLKRHWNKKGKKNGNKKGNKQQSGKTTPITTGGAGGSSSPYSGNKGSAYSGSAYSGSAYSGSGYGGGYTYVGKTCKHFMEEVDLGNGTFVYATQGRASNSPRAEADIPDFGLYADSTWATKTTSRNEFINWPDMNIPKHFDVFYEQLISAYNTYIIHHKRLEIGCIGAHGRTGTMMACFRMLAMQGKVEAEEAIKWVREVYCDHAIETVSQENFISKFGNYQFGHELVVKTPPPKPAYTPPKTSAYSGNKPGTTNTSKWQKPSSVNNPATGKPLPPLTGSSKQQELLPQQKGVYCQVVEHMKMLKEGKTICEVNGAACQYWEEDRDKYASDQARIAKWDSENKTQGTVEAFLEEVKDKAQAEAKANEESTVKVDETSTEKELVTTK